jgi:hypothetical protein
VDAISVGKEIIVTPLTMDYSTVSFNTALGLNGQYTPSHSRHILNFGKPNAGLPYYWSMLYLLLNLVL